MPSAWPGLLLFAAFLAVAAVDGIYYHMVRFRLWATPDTWSEHLVHSVRAVLVPPTLYCAFSPAPGALVLMLALVAADVAATSVDVAIERGSRVRFGGLPPGEYACHLLATALHFSAITVVVTERLLHGGAAPRSSAEAHGALLILVVLAGAGAAHHVYLAARGRAATLVSPSIPEERPWSIR